jgi:hypothetical protein
MTACAILASEIKASIFEILECVVANGDALGVPIIGWDANAPNSLEEVLLDDDVVCAPDPDGIHTILGGIEGESTKCEIGGVEQVKDIRGRSRVSKYGLL